MNQHDLRRFEALYRSVTYLGADSLLRNFLGLPDEYVLPLTIAHGVDFGQVHGAMDVRGPEPLYWACNRDSLRKAAAVKPAILIPHPFLLAASRLKPEAGDGTLVIGPPPGPAHDRALRALLRGRESEATILVKPKQGYERSLDFWRSEGFQAITLADQGAPSYGHLAQFLQRFANIVSPIFSSVVFFAAALGKPVEMLSGFRVRAWETADIEEAFAFRSDEARAVASIFIEHDRERQRTVAGTLLGAAIDRSPRSIREELEHRIASLQRALHVSEGWPGPAQAILRSVATWSNRPGLLSQGPKALLGRLRAPRIVLQDLDEVALWRDGPDRTNPVLSVHPFVPGKTIPGDAEVPYP